MPGYLRRRGVKSLDELPSGDSFATDSPRRIWPVRMIAGVFDTSTKFFRRLALGCGTFVLIFVGIAIASVFLDGIKYGKTDKRTGETEVFTGTEALDAIKDRALREAGKAIDEAREAEKLADGVDNDGKADRPKQTRPRQPSRPGDPVGNPADNSDDPVTPPRQ